MSDFANLWPPALRRGGIDDVVLQHGEFVAAEAGDHVGLAYASLETFGDRARQLTAGRAVEARLVSGCA